MNHSFNVTIAERYGIEEAILIELLFWWLHKNECEELEDMFHEGRMWCRSTAKGFAKYVPYMSWQKISRLLRSLEERDVLMVGNFNTKATNQTLWYSFKDSFKEIMKEVGYDFSKMKIGTFKNENSNINTTSSINKDNNIPVNKEKRLSNDNQKNEEYSDDFLAFWKAYGYSRDKGTTYKRWNKLSEKDKKAALAALPAYFADCERCKRDKRYPAVYLNKRTWEDDFTSPEDKEEKEESPAVDEAEMAQWKKTQGWLYANVPRIADRIFQEDFEEMKRKARYKSDIVAEILKEINDSYFNGNNLSEFCVLAESEKYRNRIEA